MELHRFSRPGNRAPRPVEKKAFQGILAGILNEARETQRISGKGLDLHVHRLAVGLFDDVIPKTRVLSSESRDLACVCNGFGVRQLSDHKLLIPQSLRFCRRGVQAWPVMPQCRMDRGEFEKGISLINTRRFFEAHEVLEDLWRPMPLDDPDRRVMQGLVQIAVALHHCSTGNRTGALSVMRRAARNIAPADQHALNLRFDLLHPAIASWIADLARETAAPPPTVQILFVS